MAKKKVNPIITILAWIVTIVIVIVLMLIVNRKSFKNQVTAPKTVMEQLDFPLNKVTVDLKKKEFMDVLRNCTWLNVSNNIGNSISITPAAGSEEIYESIVNQSENAAKLASLYKDQGFKWDAEKLELTLPVKGSVVSAPAWLVFQLVQDGLFTEIDEE